jgi:L-ascorbate metabolism protein UlaG (beta-lactamase superfamily)
VPDSVRLIRHATLQLEIGGRRLLVDPMLGPAGSRPAIEGTPSPRPNPLVELPEPSTRVVTWAEAVLVTHLHADHLDDLAGTLIGDRLPVFCQPDDVPALLTWGLMQATPVGESLAWQDVTLVRTGGRHGTGEIGERMGPVSGFVVRAGGRTAYVAGDTIWCDEVRDALATWTPDVVVVNAGAARFLEGDPITMDAGDVLAVREAAPEGCVVVAVHLESINHCLETRADLAAAVAGRDVVIPADGETVAF